MDPVPKIETFQESLKAFKVTRDVNNKPGVVLVELNRPKRLNALNKDFFHEIPKVFAALHSDPDVRCIVLAGSGKGFSSGLDMDLLMEIGASVSDSELDASRKGLNNVELITWLQSCISSPERCRYPVIAAIHGMCIGGGVDLVCSTDVRFCSEQTIFSVRETKVGLAADIGTLQRLPKIVKSHAWVQDCIDYAANIAKLSPVAVIGTKRSLLHCRDHGVLSGLNQIAEWNACMLQTQDIPKVMEAKMSKTQPEFREVVEHPLDELEMMKSIWMLIAVVQVLYLAITDSRPTLTMYATHFFCFIVNLLFWIASGRNGEEVGRIHEGYLARSVLLQRLDLFDMQNELAELAEMSTEEQFIEYRQNQRRQNALEARGKFSWYSKFNVAVVVALYFANIFSPRVFFLLAGVLTALIQTYCFCLLAPTHLRLFRQSLRPGFVSGRFSRTYTTNNVQSSRRFTSFLRPSVISIGRPKLVGGMVGSLVAGLGYYQYISSPGASSSDMKERVANLKLLSDKTFEASDNMLVLFIREEADLMRRCDDIAKVIQAVDAMEILPGGVRPSIMYSVQPESLDIPEMKTETVLRVMLYKGMRKKSITLEPSLAVSDLLKGSGVGEFFVRQSLSEKELPDSPPLVDYVTGENFMRDVVQKSSPEAPILVQMYEDSCFMCFLMRPFINSLAVIVNEMGLPVTIKRINIENNDFPEGCPVTRGTPTFCVFKGVGVEDKGNENAPEKWEEFKPNDLLKRFDEEFFQNKNYVTSKKLGKKVESGKEKLKEYSDDVNTRMQLFTQVVLWSVEAQKLQNSAIGDHGEIDDAAAEEKSPARRALLGVEVEAEVTGDGAVKGATRYWIPGGMQNRYWIPDDSKYSCRGVIHPQDPRHPVLAEEVSPWKSRTSKTTSRGACMLLCPHCHSEIHPGERKSVKAGMIPLEERLQHVDKYFENVDNGVGRIGLSPPAQGRTVSALIEEDMTQIDNLPQNLTRLRKEVDEAERDALFQAKMLGEWVQSGEKKELEEHEKAFPQSPSN
eukprot:gene983-1101_t